MEEKLKIDYKDTLNLPSTKFKMRANAAVKELDIQKFWKDQNIYKKIKLLKNEIKDIIKSINKDLGNMEAPEVLKLRKSGDLNPLKKSINTIVNDLTKYGSDIVEKILQKDDFINRDSAKGFVEKLNNIRKGGRTIFTLSAIATTSIFLYFTPKMYQQSKEFPGIAGLKKNNYI